MSATTSDLSFNSRENPDEMTAKSTADEAFQQFADAMPSMVWTCSADGSANFFNQKWCELTGLSLQESLGHGWAQAVHPDDQQRVLATWQDAIQTRHNHEIEFRYRMVDGSYRWHLVKSIPTLNADGTVHHWQGICTDIDSQHESLESSEAMIRAIVDSAVDGIITIDDRGIVLSCNPAAERLFGYTVSEIKGQNVKMLMPSSYASNHDRYVANYVKTGERKIISIGLEVEGRRKDGTSFPIELAVSEFRVGGRTHFAGIIRDISVRKRWECELRGRSRVLERLVEGRSLSEILKTLLEVASELRPGMIGSILLLDQEAGCLRHGASLHLPDSYREACDGMVPGPSVGSCGTAAFTGKRVIVEDISTHPFWENDRDIALRASLRACWSEPIIASCGRVIGTFAMYYKEKRTPDAADLEFVGNAAKLATVAIERLYSDNIMRQMAAIVDSTDDAIILKNLYGVIEKWNPGAERVYGYSAKEAVGRPIKLFVPEDRIYELDANAERLRQRERVDHFETIRLTKDGRRIHVASTISPVLDSNGILSHFVEVQNDITQRVQAQAELNRERSVLDAIVHSIPDAILHAGLDRKISFVNESACRIFGYDRGEMEGQYGAIFYADHDDFLKQGERRFNLTATPQKDIQEINWRRKNGEVFAGELVGTIIRDSYGKPVGYQAIIRDVSDRKRAEATIRENQRQLSTLINNLPGAAFRCKCDNDWTMEFISDGCQDLTGFAPEEFMSATSVDNPTFLSWASVILAEDRENVAMEIGQAVAEKRPFQLIYRVRHRNGDVRWLWEQGEGVLTEEGQVVALEGYISDITELHDMRDQLVQSERLAAVGQMISAIAHESRNALQRIQVGTDMLELELGEDSDVHGDLQRINRAKEDLLHLFEELRSYAAPLQLDVAAKNLAEVWHQAWANLEVSRKDCDAVLIEAVGEFDLTCRVDAFRIEQVFRNLMENALAACSAPVRITVSCAESEIDGEPAVCVSVRDNGPGLTDEQRVRIFEAFFTTKSKGTGLGMAIAARIVEAHQGTIAIGDAKEGGAEFLITLPRAL